MDAKIVGLSEEEKKQKNYDSLLKRYYSGQESMKELLGRVNSLEGVISILEREKKQWEQDKEIWNQMVSHQCGSNDAIVQQLQNEIISIKGKLCPDCKKRVR